MVTEGKKEEKINKCAKQLLGESIIQFLHELLIHAISHARVSQSPIALLTSFLLPAGRYARRERQMLHGMSLPAGVPGAHFHHYSHVILLVHCGLFSTLW